MDHFENFVQLNNFNVKLIKVKYNTAITNLMRKFVLNLIVFFS